MLSHQWQFDSSNIIINHKFNCTKGSKLRVELDYLLTFVPFVTFVLSVLSFVRSFALSGAVLGRVK
jgi:hypothetical protein